jgi:[ribosomal protein S5]-alanine N-acetyltransferase
MTVPVPIATTLTTLRLTLVAATARHLETELENPALLGVLLAATVPGSWPPGEYDRGAMGMFLRRLESGGTDAIGWYGWYGIRRATAEVPATLILSAGYLGPPGADGIVEMGYSVVPEWRGHGYAAEAVSALVRHALNHQSVRRVVAHAADANTASHAVLTRCGFTRVGPGKDPGYVRFERPRSAVSAPAPYRLRAARD